MLLAPCSGDDGLLEAFHAIRARDARLPIIYLRDPTGDSAPGREIDAETMATIALPVRHADLQYALQQAMIHGDERGDRGGPRSPELFRNLVGSSAGVRKVRRLIEKVGKTDATVLLLGESGTGKEVVARNIHYHSQRRYKPFVPVNCGAIPPDLLESELFGHEKGAFTGAISARRGRFEMAAGGDAVPRRDRRHGRLGHAGEAAAGAAGAHLPSGSAATRASPRMPASSPPPTAIWIEAIVVGRFREDLYYRLNVFPMEMPTLRSRVEDLPLLVNDLVNEDRAREARHDTHHAGGDGQPASRYQWPGNVRELANLIERLVILFPYGTVDAQDLPERYRVARLHPAAHADAEEGAMAGTSLAAQQLPSEGLDLKEHMNKLESMFIVQALDEAGGIVAHAARRLRMGRTTLVEKMRKLGIRRHDTNRSHEQASNA